ncbi:MAG: hypothetical protein AB1689_04050 [Thermodesulfobacteriota bacterium]
MRIRVGTVVAAAGLTAVALATQATDARAQSNAAFGVQQRADAARQLIILGVSQGISSLPPTTGQSFVYEYDEALDTYKATGLLGPTAYRSPLTLGKGKMSLRVAGSYFELVNTQNPIDYEVTGLAQPVFTKFGLKVNAKVGLFNLAYSYGVLDWLEVNINVPITIVDAQAKSSFVTLASAADEPIEDAPVAAATSLAALDANLADGDLIVREGTVNQLGAAFREGTTAGLGRVSIGGKALFLNSEYVDMAFSMEVFFPSPSEPSYSGPDSGAFLPRLIAAVNMTNEAKLHVDVGYDHDTEFAQLRRFVWNTGASYAIPGFTVDAGVGGSKFSKGIEWTPSSFVQPPGQEIDVPLTFTALGDNTLGTNYVDFLFGVKGQVLENAVVSGSVNVPLNSDGIRPEAVGTVAFEMYF